MRNEPLIIAHRGLLNGPDAGLENLPSTIETARSGGYDVEIDVWYNNGSWFLGHDRPDHPITIDWLANLGPSNTWIHAKNINALYELQKKGWPGHLFYHQNDDVVLTNTGYLWTFPGRQLTPLSVCVMPEWMNMFDQEEWPHDRIKQLDILAFCTDHVLELEAILSA